MENTVKDRAIKKIKSTPGITKELRYGGCLLFDKKTGAVFHCCSDDSTYYQKWNDKHGKFILFEWQCGGLSGYDLRVLDESEYQAT